MLKKFVIVGCKDIFGGIYAAKDYREHREAAQRSGPSPLSVIAPTDNVPIEVEPVSHLIRYKSRIDAFLVR